MATLAKIEDARTYRIGDWLGLAAAPTFAAMAWAMAGAPAGICASDAGMLPVDGMAWMYLLMSLFHLPPWLRLASRRHAAAHRPHTQTEGD